MTKQYWLYLFFLISAPIQANHFDRLTVLTRPIGSKENPQGHAMVTRSLIAGLSQLNIPFNYNPQRMDEVGDAIIVLANTQALAQAINLKKHNPTKLLFAGPNLVVWPSDHNGILLSPLIDKVIVPSEPTRHMYAEISPIIRDRLHIWFVGVNHNRWQPLSSDFNASSAQNNRNVLVYWKNQNEGPQLKNAVLKTLKQFGWHPLVLTYGNHTHNQYKAILDKVRFGVFLSRSESQGIALAEAWSTNVPTICWNPQERTNRGRIYSAVSSCPYLTRQTGNEWKTIQDLHNLLETIEHELIHFSPRKWVLNNMTDALCAQHLINAINRTYEERTC